MARRYGLGFSQNSFARTHMIIKGLRRCGWRRIAKTQDFGVVFEPTASPQGIGRLINRDRVLFALQVANNQALIGVFALGSDHIVFITRQSGDEDSASMGDKWGPAVG